MASNLVSNDSMRAGLFWLNDRQWACMAPQLPTNLTGPEREDDRRIISGIIHMLQCGARWRDCPPEYGPYTTVYNRFNNRWAKRGRWQAIFETLARAGGQRPASAGLHERFCAVRRS
jgi:transposase